MKKNLVVLLLTLYACVCQAQFSFRIKVVDAGNDADISGAKIYISEIVAADKYTDQNGLVVYNNFPRGRTVHISVRKEGYTPLTTEATVPTTGDAQDNLTVKLTPQKDLTRILIWGKLLDENGVGMKNCRIALCYLGRSSEVQTDDYGNYKFEVPKEQFENVRTYCIDYRLDSCARSNAFSYYGSFFENRDIRLTCRPGPAVPHEQPKEPEYKYNYNGANLVGAWVYDTLEQKVKTTIILIIQNNGQSELIRYNNGKYASTVSQTWRYQDGLFIEASSPMTLHIGRINWNTSYDFVLAVLDYGRDVPPGVLRHFRRYH